MNKFLSLAVGLILAGLSFSQKISHELSMPNPETHYFHVEVTLEDFSEDTITLALPVWAPGSYLVREFSRHIDVVRAADINGEALKVYKTRKNHWVIVKGNSSKVIVNYEVYAFDLTVRTSFLDRSHGFVNGSNVFMYPIGYKNLGGELSIQKGIFSRISTILPPKPEGVANDGQETFMFSDYDELADSPIEIGNHEEFTFEAAGALHRVAMYGSGNYHIPTLQKDMARIVEVCVNVFKGDNPNKEYLFIIHNTHTGSGGLEHMASTVLNVNRWTYEGPAYNRFLSLVAHEYFHLWLVKRLRPIQLGPFDYDRENYTDLLWVMEGFTSYYDDLLMRRAGFYSEQEYLNKIQGTMNFVENTHGNSVHPVAHSSFDAWIKLYRPDENTRNSRISYYSKGHLVAATIDAMIMEQYKGKKSMDDFLLMLYNKYYKELDRGFSEAEFKEELEKFLKRDLTKFFEDHIYDSKTIDYPKYFKPLGIDLRKDELQKVQFGITTAMENGKLIVKNVDLLSAAKRAGLSPNDEIIAFNSFRVDQTALNNFMGGLNPGDPFVLIVSRDHELMVIQAEMGTMDQVRYVFDTTHKNKIGQYWLRTDEP